MVLSGIMVRLWYSLTCRQQPGQRTQELAQVQMRLQSLDNDWLDQALLQAFCYVLVASATPLITHGVLTRGATIQNVSGHKKHWQCQ